MLYGKGTMYDFEAENFQLQYFVFWMSYFLIETA